MKQTRPPLERRWKMKHLLLTTIAGVLLVGRASTSQHSTSPLRTKTAEQVAEATELETTGSPRKS